MCFVWVDFFFKLTFSRKQNPRSVLKQSFRAIEVVWSFFFGQKKKVSKKVSNFRATTRLETLATQDIIGPETVSKQHRRNSLWGMYTLMAVYVLFFNRFIDLMLNFHTNPNKLAPVGCCESGCPVSQPKTTTCNWNLITSSAGQCSVKIPATTPCYLKVWGEIRRALVIIHCRIRGMVALIPRFVPRVQGWGFQLTSA